MCPFYLISISHNSEPQRIPAGLSLHTYWAQYTTMLGLVPGTSGSALSPQVSHRLQERWTMTSGICPFHQQTCVQFCPLDLFSSDLQELSFSKSHLSRFLIESSAQREKAIATVPQLRPRDSCENLPTATSTVHAFSRTCQVRAVGVVSGDCGQLHPNRSLTCLFLQ